MTQKREWVESKPGSENQWKPQMNEANNFTMSQKKEDNQLQGYYLSSKDVNGKDGTFTVHTVQPVNEDGSLGLKTDVIGNKVLNELMATVSMGTFVCVMYAGRRHKQGNEGKAWSQTNSYHIWKLFQDPNAVPYNKVPGATVQNTASVNTTAAVNTGNTNSAANSTTNPFPEDDDLPF